MSILSDRLKELRGSQSQREMAEPVGIKWNAWARYERGEVAPGAEILRQICIVHSCSSDWLLGLSERGGSAVNAPNNSGAIAVGRNAKAAAGKDNKRTTTSSACDSCKYKKFSEAFKAIQTPD